MYSLVSHVPTISDCPKDSSMTESNNRIKPTGSHTYVGKQVTLQRHTNNCVTLFHFCLHVPMSKPSGNASKLQHFPANASLWICIVQTICLLLMSESSHQRALKSHISTTGLYNGSTFGYCMTNSQGLPTIPEPSIVRTSLVTSRGKSSDAHLFIPLSIFFHISFDEFEKGGKRQPWNGQTSHQPPLPLSSCCLRRLRINFALWQSLQDALVHLPAVAVQQWTTVSWNGSLFWKQRTATTSHHVNE